MRWTIFVLASCAIPTTGCSTTTCTELGCLSGFTLSIEATTLQRDKTYLVDLVLDGKSERATCVHGAVDGWTCSWPETTPAFVWEGSGFARITLYVPGNPRSISANVSVGSVSVASKTFTPTYSTTQPNGPGCEPTCTQASGSLPIP